MSEVDPKHKPRFYYDVTAGELLIGERAMEAHLEAGGMISNIEELGSMIIRGQQLKNVTPADISIDWPSLTADELRTNSMWLYSLLATIDRGPDKRVKQTNHHITSAIARIGFGLSLKSIYDSEELGSIDSFYRLMGLKNVHRVNTRGIWNETVLLGQIQNVGTRLRRRPFEKDLRQRWIQDPDNNPHPEVYAEVFGSYSAACEKVGYFVPKIRKKEDYLDWAVTFRWVNNGLGSGYKVLRRFSNRGFGPAESTCIDNYGNLMTYNDLADDRYQQELREHEAKKTQLIGAIQTEIARDGRILGLFIDARTEAQVLEIYSKYLLSQEFSSLTPVALIQASVLDTDNWVEEVVQHRRQNSLSAKDIVEYATQQKLLYFIWPPKKTHPHLAMKEAPKITPPRSATTIIGREKAWERGLKKLREFRDSSISDTQKTHQDRSHREARALEIQQGIASGEIPVGLFKGADSAEEIIKRYARHKLFTQIAGDEIDQWQIVRSCIPPQTVEQLVSKVSALTGFESEIIKNIINNSDYSKDLSIPK